MRPVIPYVTAALLFGLGVYGALRRRNAVLLLMAVELMLGAVNLILITATAAPYPGLPHTAETAAMAHTGQVFALFVIVIAAAEVGVGLAIVLQLYRLRAGIAVDAVPLDETPAPSTSPGEAPTSPGEAPAPPEPLDETPPPAGPSELDDKSAASTAPEPAGDRTMTR